VTGSGLNITVWSYVDQLAISVLTDDLTLDDPHEATDAMIDAFIEIRTAAGLSGNLTPVGTPYRWPRRPVERYPMTRNRAHGDGPSLASPRGRMHRPAAMMRRQSNLYRTSQKCHALCCASVGRHRGQDTHGSPILHRR
jgi:hypothetical protein